MVAHTCREVNVLLIRRLVVVAIFSTIIVAGLKLAGVPMCSLPDYMASRCS